MLTELSYSVYEKHPIVDIQVYTRKGTIFPNYQLITKSLNGKSADLNPSSATETYLAYTRLPSDTIAPSIYQSKKITNNTLALGESGSGSGSGATTDTNSNTILNNGNITISADKVATNLQINTSNWAPLTAISVFFPDMYEEQPFGYEILSCTMNQQTGNLNKNTNSHRSVFLSLHRGGSAPDYSVYADDLFDPQPKPLLCDMKENSMHQARTMVDNFSKIVSPSSDHKYMTCFNETSLDLESSKVHGIRGCGAPIVDIATYYPTKEPTPVDWQEVRWSSLGHKANLNSGTDSTEMRLVYRVNVEPVLCTLYMPYIQKAKEYMTESSSQQVNKIPKYDAYLVDFFARACAILTSCLYSGNESVVLATIEAAYQIPFITAPPQILNTFLHSICDAVPCLLSYFTTHSHSTVLKFLVHVTHHAFPSITVYTLQRIFDICYLLRHEDKIVGSSKSLIDIIVTEANKASSLLLHTNSNTRDSLMSTIDPYVRYAHVSTYIRTHVLPNIHKYPQFLDVLEKAKQQQQQMQITNINSGSSSSSTNNTSSSVVASTPVVPNNASNSAAATADSDQPPPTLTPALTQREGSNASTSSLAQSGKLAQLSVLLDDQGFSAVTQEITMKGKDELRPSVLKSTTSPLISPISLKRTPTTPGSTTNASSMNANNTLKSANEVDLISQAVVHTINSNVYDTCANMVRSLIDKVFDACISGVESGQLKRKFFGSENITDSIISIDRLVTNTNGRNWLVNPPLGYTPNPILFTEEYVQKSKASSTVNNTHSANALTHAKQSLEKSMISISLDRLPTLEEIQHAQAGPETEEKQEKQEKVFPKHNNITRIFHPNPDVDAYGNPYEWKYIKLENPLLKLETESMRRKRKRLEKDQVKEKTLLARKRRAEERAIEAKYKCYINYTTAHVHNVQSKAERMILMILLNACKIASSTVMDCIPPHPSSSLALQLIQLPKQSNPQYAYTHLLPYYIMESVGHKSDTSKRRAHALNLILHLLLRADGFFKSNTSCITVLRRYVMPTLMLNCLVNDSNTIFRTVLQTFVVISNSFQKECMAEIGLFFDKILLEILLHPLCSIDLKKDIIDAIEHILATPSSVINLYNVHDLTGYRNVYERLIRVMSYLTQGILNEKTTSTSTNTSNNNNNNNSNNNNSGNTNANGEEAPTGSAHNNGTPPATPQHGNNNSGSGDANNANNNNNSKTDNNLANPSDLFQKQPSLLHRKSIITTNEDGNIVLCNDIGQVNLDEASQALSMIALRFLVQQLHMLAQWAGVPSVKRSDDATKALHLTCLSFLHVIVRSPFFPVFYSSNKEYITAIHNATVQYKNAQKPYIQAPGILEDFLSAEGKRYIRRLYGANNKRLTICGNAGGIANNSANINMGVGSRRMTMITNNPNTLVNSVISMTNMSTQSSKMALRGRSETVEVPGVPNQHWLLDKSSDFSVFGLTNEEVDEENEILQANITVPIDMILGDLVSNEIGYDLGLYATLDTLSKDMCRKYKCESVLTYSNPLLLERARWVHALKDVAVACKNQTSMKPVLNLLKNKYPHFLNPYVLPKLLFRNESVDDVCLGDFLGTFDDQWFNSEQYTILRYGYTNLIDFSGMTFVNALRFYLTECGFRLPGEGQKIDRLLEAFCHAYCKDNPDEFINPDVAHILCFSMIMLNTDLNDPRLSTAKGTTRMSLKAFMNNLRDCNDGKPIDPLLLTSIYTNIALNPIVWNTSEPPGGSSASNSNNNNNNNSNNSKDMVVITSDDPYAIACTNRAHMIFKKTSTQSIYHKAMCELRPISYYTQTSDFTFSTQILSSLWQSVWMHYVSAITTKVELSPLFDLSTSTLIPNDNNTNSNTNNAMNQGNNTNVSDSDIETLHWCLDGIAYGASLCAAIESGKPKDAFLRLLAKITFVSQNTNKDAGNKDTAGGKDTSSSTSSRKGKNTKTSTSSSSSSSTAVSFPTTKRELYALFANGAHLQQTWMKSLSSFSCVAECKKILEVAMHAKHSISFHRRQQILRQLEVDFSGNVPLVSPLRSFVKDGKLIKLSSAGKRQEYHFWLFNDLLLYGSETTQSRYKMHRCIHLSLLRIVELPNHQYPHAFKLVSPQKSFIVVASSAEEKDSWVLSIVDCIKLVLIKRTEWLNEDMKKSVAIENKVSQHIITHDGFHTIQRGNTNLSSPTSQVSTSSDEIAMTRTSTMKTVIRPEDHLQIPLTDSQSIPLSPTSLVEHNRRSHEDDDDDDDDDDGIDNDFLQEALIQPAYTFLQTEPDTTNTAAGANTTTRTTSTKPSSNTTSASKNPESSDVSTPTTDTNALLTKAIDDALPHSNSMDPETEDLPFRPIMTRASSVTGNSNTVMQAIEDEINFDEMEVYELEAAPTAITIAPPKNLDVSGAAGLPYMAQPLSPNSALSMQEKIVKYSNFVHLHGGEYCQLCLTKYALFKRKATCINCNQTVCDACMQHRIKIKDKQQKVCDLCWGYSTCLIGDHQPVFSIEE